jgi:hypothetical protein
VTVTTRNVPISRSQLVRFLATENKLARQKEAYYREVMGMPAPEPTDPKVDAVVELCYDGLGAAFAEAFADQLLDGEAENFGQNIHTPAIVLDTLQRMRKAWPEEFTASDIKEIEEFAPHVISQMIQGFIDAFNDGTPPQEIFTTRWQYIGVVAVIAAREGVEPSDVLTTQSLQDEVERTIKTREEYRANNAKWLDMFVESVTSVIRASIDAVLSFDGDVLEEGEFEEIMAEITEENGIDFDAIRDRLKQHLESEELRIYGPV